MANSDTTFSRYSRIGIPLCVAGIIFLIFPLIGELYELQLREFSAWMAEIFLRATHLDVSRQGTILSLPGMTFDIIPACSGSEMLRTLLFVGVFWGGVHPYISPPRKLLAALLSAVIALLSNGIRLTILLGASYLSGEVIEEGLLHSMIGLSAFAIALPCFFVVTELLAVKKEHDASDASPSSNMLAFTAVLTAIAYLPVVSASIVAWQGPVYNEFDKFGYIFFIIGALGWAWCWRATTADHGRMKHGSLLFALCCLAALLSQIPGPNKYVLGITLMISIFAVGLAYRNLHFALRCLPFQCIIFLSLPKVSEMINLVLQTNGILVPLAIKSALTLLALAFFILICLPIKRPFIPLQPSTKWSALMTFSAAVTMIGMFYFVRSDFTEESKTYTLPFILGQRAEWIGQDIQDAESLLFYQRSNVVNRQYTRSGETVGVMIVPSNGNRKTIHTPEYCQIGLGWNPLSSEAIEFTNTRGEPAKARKLILKNEETGVQRTFIYWFGDEEGVTIANYPTFLIADTWRKLFGNRTNWSLYVVWSDTDTASAIDFLSSLPIIEARD